MKRLMKSSRSTKSYPLALKSMFFIAVVAVIGFMTTQALFVDREISEENTFVVGTLDMNVTGENATQAETITVTGLGSQNVTSGGKRWQINNSGSLPGELLFEVSQIQNFENGCNEPEALVDTTCDSPGLNQGELGQHIKTTVSIKIDNTPPLFENTLATGAESSYRTLWKEQAQKVTIPAGESIVLEFNWSTEASTFENEVQSDGVTFETLFQLKQVAPDSNQAPNP